MIPACPVVQEQHSVAKSARSLARAIKRLNRDRQLCESCPSSSHCPTAERLNMTIHTALAEVNFQWEALKED